MIVACVRTGDKYPVEYVRRLKAGLDRHLRGGYEFVCITDQWRDVLKFSTPLPTSLPSWWAKLQLFEPKWRGDERALYFDLDTAVCGDLLPLRDLECDFGICENFTRLAGHRDWPCRYGSAVMTIAGDWGADLWDWFQQNRRGIMLRHERTGDQGAIEEWWPPERGVTYLQRALPGFFLGYRDLPKHKAPPAGCSVVVFAGQHKPHNTDCAWAREAWAA